MQRIILHLDMDYFFAQAEEIRHPELKGKPLAVCVYSARGKDSGAVGTANYAARKLGIKSGIPIAFAKKIADANTTFLPVDHEYYSEISDRIMKKAKEFADKFEQAGIDEAYLDISDKCTQNFEKTKELALKLKKEIFQQEKLTVSVGIGPNKMIAKIACGQKKPDGLTIVTAKQAKQFLAPLDVSEIPGVGVKTGEELKKMGIKTIKELSKANPQKLINAFGKSRGTMLQNSAHGIDKSPIEENYEQQQISRITTLKKDSNKFEEIQPIIFELSKEVIGMTRKQGKFFKTVSIMAVSNEMQMHSKSKTLEKHSNSVHELQETAKQLLEEFLRQNPKTAIRRIGIRTANFAKEQKQKTLAEF